MSEMLQKFPLSQAEVERKKRSFEQLGQIYPEIVASEDGDMLRGNHAKAAGGTKVQAIPITPIAQRLGVSPYLAKLVFSIHADCQRTVPREETQAKFLKLANGLSAEIPKQKVAARMVQLIPYSVSEIYELLPEQFKEKKRSEGTKAGIAKAKAEKERSSTRGGADESDVEKEYHETQRSKDLRAEIMEAIDKLEELETKEKADLGAGPPPKKPYSGASARMSELSRKADTPGENLLQNFLSSIRRNGKSLSVVYNKRVPVADQGEWSRKVQARLPDSQIEGWLCMEVEGEGSNSSDNEQRDKDLKAEGKRLIHISNKIIGNPLAQEVFQQFILLCLEMGPPKRKPVVI